MAERKFITQNISDSMFSDITKDRVFTIEDLELEDLRKEVDLKSYISNNGLLGLLRERGIDFTPVSNKFQLEIGDSVYVIVPSADIKPYREADNLPTEITVKKVRKYTVIKRDSI